mmetsp:Transcript_276/g.749  ORF Transcript_276/g.749 Transcript_276/m.749 type:complete len:298 (-) Transcript_276:94-987(-)
MHGADARARANNERTALSDSPTYLSSNSGPFTDIKLAAAAAATARATKVLPQPGGPYNKTPDGSGTPRASNRFGSRIGANIEARKASRTSLMPPTSKFQSTSGRFAKPLRMKDGATLERAASTSACETPSTTPPRLTQPAPAAFASWMISAPAQPGHFWAIPSTSMAPDRRAGRCLSSSAARASLSGAPTPTSRSKRPKRLNLASTASASRDVATTTTTAASPFLVDGSASNKPHKRLDRRRACVSPPFLSDPVPSSASKSSSSTNAGAADRALSNNRASCCSASGPLPKSGAATSK